MTENDHRSRSRSNAEGYLSFPKTKGHFAEENSRFFITVKTEFLRRLRPSEQRHGNDPLGPLNCGTKDCVPRQSCIIHCALLSLFEV